MIDARTGEVMFVEQPVRSATVVLSRPSPQPSTIRERNAKAREDFARLNQRSNVSRSSSLKISSVFGRPARGMFHSTT